MLFYDIKHAPLVWFNQNKKTKLLLPFPKPYAEKKKCLLVSFQMLGHTSLPFADCLSLKLLMNIKSQQKYAIVSVLSCFCAEIQF